MKPRGALAPHTRALRSSGRSDRTRPLTDRTAPWALALAFSSSECVIQEGRRWVVDVDLEKFFDRVNHDVLMGRLGQGPWGLCKATSGGVPDPRYGRKNRDRPGSERPPVAESRGASKFKERVRQITSRSGGRSCF